VFASQNGILVMLIQPLALVRDSRTIPLFSGRGFFLKWPWYDLNNIIIKIFMQKIIARRIDAAP